MNPILSIENLRIGYGNEEILRIYQLDLQPNTITALLGPSGCGKSSFLSAILRNSPSLSYWEKGSILLNGRVVDQNMSESSIAVVLQKARLYTGTVLENFADGVIENQSKSVQKVLAEKIFTSIGVWNLIKNILDEPAIKQSMGIHKILLIAKAVAAKPQLLLMDEVLANTSMADEKIIIKMIKKLKKLTTVLLITHNKEEAKELSDSVALVSGGLLHEHTDTATFFQNPSTEIGKEFIKSGSAWYSNPNNSIDRKIDKLSILRRFSSMCEFYWVLPNVLGGMQKPGLITELDDDLDMMQQLGVNVLVTLQQKPIDKEVLSHYGITGLHFPIQDMGIPDLKDTYDFLQSIQKYFDSGNSVVYHCKAGMGRTGTLLACNLVWLKNISAIKAIDKIRYVNYKYIQTEEQMEFVSRFESYFNKRNSNTIN